MESASDIRRRAHADYVREWRRKRREKSALMAEVEAALADHPEGGEIVAKVKRIAES